MVNAHGTFIEWSGIKKKSIRMNTKRLKRMG
jgi:hypothetical protein